MIQSYKDLQVFRLSYDLAMEVFRLTKKFPKEELFENWKTYTVEKQS